MKRILTPQPGGVFRLTLPDGAPGHWCHLAVQLAGAGPWWVKLEIEDPARGQIVRAAFLGPAKAGRGGEWRAILLHLPGEAAQIALRVFRADDKTTSLVTVRFRQLGRWGAAWRLAWQGRGSILPAVRGDVAGVPGRLRRVLGQGALRRGEAPPYALWQLWYEACDAAALAGVSAGITVAIVAGSGADAQAVRCSVESVRSQYVAPAAIVCLDTVDGVAAIGGAWVLVLAAGELLAPWALGCFALAARAQARAAGFYADLDYCVGGARADPLLKPAHADSWLLAHGLLSRGACLFRREMLARTPPRAPLDAESWRRELAICCGAEAFLAISLILTHVGNARPAVCARVVLRGARAQWPKVTMLIPTAARGRHVRACLRRLIARTDYPDLEILCAVSRLDREDAAQAATVAALARLPGVRVVDLAHDSFNYARVNNAAAQQARGDLLLLINDDVVPLHHDWLRDLVHALGPAAADGADIVGPRLLYGDGSVQHGGVIMGLAHLCEHAFRLCSRHDDGPHGLAKLDRRVSAVTGACMLMQTSLYHRLGGMDEAFAVALNDVDFCLRAGAAGARIKLAGGVALYHYESLSLGRHYEGGRAALEALEVGRLRARWAASIAADPFYNPCASRELGREFQPAFPPRHTALSWIEAERREGG